MNTKYLSLHGEFAESPVGNPDLHPGIESEKYCHVSPFAFRIGKFDLGTGEELKQVGGPIAANDVEWQFAIE